MKWIKAEPDNLPIKKTIARGQIEIFGSRLFIWSPDSVKPEHFNWEWLDESESSFELNNIINAYNEGIRSAKSWADSSDGRRTGFDDYQIEQDKIEYFKTKFNIDI
jgi:hypothetical protein